MEASLVLKFPNSCKLLVLQDLWNIQWLGFRKFLFEKGVEKLSWWEKDFAGNIFQDWVLIFYSLLDWKKEFGSYKTFREKESWHRLVYLRFCVCRVKEFGTYSILVSFFYLNLIYQILFKKRKIRGFEGHVFFVRNWWAFFERKLNSCECDYSKSWKNH